MNIYHTLSVWVWVLTFLPRKFFKNRSFQSSPVQLHGGPWPLSDYSRRAFKKTKKRFLGPYHPWDWYIYLHEWLSLMVKYGFHVGKYTIHGWYGWGKSFGVNCLGMRHPHLEVHLNMVTTTFSATKKLSYLFNDSWKNNMEHNHGGLENHEDYFPFYMGDLQIPVVNLQGCKPHTWICQEFDKWLVGI